MIGVSPSYVGGALCGIRKWMHKLNRNRRGTRYRIKKSGSDDSEATTFAVPYGFGSPIRKMINGEISWKACLIWIMLKFDSDWITGLSNPTSMLNLAKICSFSPQTVCDCIKELTEAKLLERTTANNEPAVYQLYPKPKAKAKEKSEAGMLFGYECDGGYVGKTHAYSLNRQYRICLNTGFFEKRFGKGKNDFKRCSDYHVAQCIPKSILNALLEIFETHVQVRRSLKQQFAQATA